MGSEQNTAIRYSKLAFSLLNSKIGWPLGTMTSMSERIATATMKCRVVYCRDAGCGGVASRRLGSATARSDPAG